MDFMNVDAIRAHKIRTLLQFSIPAIISMVLTSFINIADGFFMGNFIDKDAIAAVNLGLPVIYLYLATGLMVTVGGAVLAGIALGAKDIDRCKSVFVQTVATVSVFAVALSVIMCFCFDPLLSILGAAGKVGVYFRQYYRIMLLELPLMIINSTFGTFARTEGNPQFSMGVTTLTVLLNIVLDYVFAGPCSLGVSGIALASLVSAAVGTVIMLLYFLRKSKVFSFVRISFDKNVLRDTLLNGSSEFIGELSMCLSMFAYNMVIMRRTGVDGVTAFTVVGYCAYVFSMIVCGFGQGMSPSVSFTYGAKERSLARSLCNRTILLVSGAGAAAVLLIVLTLPWYSTVFVKDAAVQSMIRTGMCIFMTDFLLCGINAISSFYFTSIGKAKESAVISSARGLVILLACIFILPVFFGMNGIWLTSPVTELLTLALTVRFLAQDAKECAA